MPLGSFICVIRMRLKLQSIDAIYLFVDGKLKQSHQSMSQLYEEHQDEDGFLYIKYSGEKTFG